MQLAIIRGRQQHSQTGKNQCAFTYDALTTIMHHPSAALNKHGYIIHPSAVLEKTNSKDTLQVWTQNNTFNVTNLLEVRTGAFK